MKRTILMSGLAILLPLAINAQAFYNNGAVVQIKNGGTLRINGAFMNLSSSSLQNDGALTVQGNITNNQAFSNPYTGTLTLNGSSAQTISGDKAFQVKHITINNVNGITLNTALEVSEAINFTNGIVNAASSSAPLRFLGGATHSGSSDASHVAGYVQKQGTGVFKFPVGDGTRYQPVSADLTANSAGLNVRYNATDAGIATFVTSGASTIALEAYNSEEYWEMSPVGTAEGKVTITWDAVNNASVTTSTNVNVFKVAHKTASGWLNEGSSAVTGSSLAGSVTSATISSWSPFTLGVISEGTLPVTLISFAAKKVEANAMLNWQTASEFNAARFEVQRSSDASTFEIIGSIEATGNSKTIQTYTYVDAQSGIYAPIVYYRLRSIDIDGSYAFSRTISLKNNDANFTTNVYPNPVLKANSVTIEASTAITRIKLWSLSGREVSVPVTHATSKKIQMDFNSLTAGVYMLQVVTPDGSTTKKLVVE